MARRPYEWDTLEHSDLLEWVKSNRIVKSVVAKELGVSASTFHSWVEGNRAPAPKFQDEIAKMILNPSIPPEFISHKRVPRPATDKRPDPKPEQIVAPAPQVSDHEQLIYDCLPTITQSTATVVAAMINNNLLNTTQAVKDAIPGVFRMLQSQIEFEVTP